MNLNSRRKKRRGLGVLDSEFIDNLNKERERSVHELNNDHCDLTIQSQAPIRESAREKKQRRMLLLRHLALSKHEKMKRKLVDLIDKLHKDELEDLKGSLEQIEPQVREFAKNG